jgi:hypothetical protein
MMGKRRAGRKRTAKRRAIKLVKDSGNDSYGHYDVDVETAYQNFLSYISKQEARRMPAWRQWLYDRHGLRFARMWNRGVWIAFGAVALVLIVAAIVGAQPKPAPRSPNATGATPQADNGNYQSVPLRGGQPKPVGTTEAHSAEARSASAAPWAEKNLAPDNPGTTFTISFQVVIPDLGAVLPALVDRIISMVTTIHLQNDGTAKLSCRLLLLVRHNSAVLLKHLEQHGPILLAAALGRSDALVARLTSGTALSDPACAVVRRHSVSGQPSGTIIAGRGTLTGLLHKLDLAKASRNGLQASSGTAGDASPNLAILTPITGS